VGQKWHDEIIDGIRECKAFILVLSPDAAESRYVREEVNKALELGKPVIPILYRPAKWSGEFGALVKNIQTLDLRSGSYAENFQKLVDGLVAAGAAKIEGYEKPFMRQPVKVSLVTAFGKIPGWAFAWGGGWAVFWFIVLLFLLFLLISQDNLGSEDILNFIIILTSGVAGGFAGGLLAGLFTMLALRPNAPSISWKHMSPTIRIWAISGPLGMIVSGIVTAIMIAVGAIGVQSAVPECEGLGFGQCIGAIFGSVIGQAVAFVLIVMLIFLLLVGIVWFLTGMFAGWQVVRHIRRLEPGITRRQGWGVSVGWGCGAIVATIVALLSIGVISSAFGL
ncbi:MAG: toll/interleukin-1 receptor domain-containing protein, partial [Anaerolineales bacterium]